MNRREMMALSAAAMAVGTRARAVGTGTWQSFTVETTLDLPAGPAAQAFVPVPAIAADWSRPGATSVSTEGTAEIVELNGATAVRAAWEASDAPRRLSVTSEVAVRDRATDLGMPRSVPPLDPAVRREALAATTLIPTGGIVKETSDGIIAEAGAETDLEKARALYDWVVENTVRDPKVRGCGLGDVASMLNMGDLSGKCADLNALFVGLARAAELPARDLYGVRVAPSPAGLKALGTAGPEVTGAQHCRAEVWLGDFGWVAIDPADVRKVMLQEKDEPLPLDHPLVVKARARLFGAAEGNWVGFNRAHDVPLPGLDSGPLPFLMYPEARIGDRWRDALDPSSFEYTITAKPA